MQMKASMFRVWRYIEHVHVKVEARRQELEALLADMKEAERKCQLQSDDQNRFCGY